MRSRERQNSLHVPVATRLRCEARETITFLFIPSGERHDQCVVDTCLAYQIVSTLRSIVPDCAKAAQSETFCFQFSH